MVDEAARHGIRVAAHAHGPEGMIAAAKAGVTSIEHGSLLTDEAVRVLKQQGTWYVPNVYLGEALDTISMPPAIRAKARTVRNSSTRIHSSSDTRSSVTTPTSVVSSSIRRSMSATAAHADSVVGSMSVSPGSGQSGSASAVSPPV